MKVTLDIPDPIWSRIEDDAEKLELDPKLMLLVGALRGTVLPKKGPPTDLLKDIRILRLHSERKNTSEIARIIGEDRQFVGRRVRLYGLKSNSAQTYSWERLEAIRLYKTKEHSVREIAKLVGVDRSTAQRWLQAYRNQAKATENANKARHGKQDSLAA